MAGEVLNAFGIGISLQGGLVLAASAIFLLWLWLRSHVPRKRREYMTIATILVLTTLFGFHFLTSSCVACSGQDTTCSCGGVSYHVVLQTGQTCSSSGISLPSAYYTCKSLGCKAAGAGCGTGYTCQSDGTCKSTGTTTTGTCGSTKNTCSSGTFTDITDTSTYYRWQCGSVTCTKAISTTPTPPPTPPSSSQCNTDCLARGCTSSSVSTGSCICSSCTSQTSICTPGETDTLRCGSSGNLEVKYVKADCSTDSWQLKEDCNTYGCANKACKPKPAANDPSLYCSDGQCNNGENCQSCWDDCSCTSPQVCSASVCITPVGANVTPPITPSVAPVKPDTGICGDGVCSSKYSENCLNCELDCNACNMLTYCGDGTCQQTEAKDTCAEDCAKPDNTWMWYALGIGAIIIAAFVLFMRKGRLGR